MTRPSSSICMVKTAVTSSLQALDRRAQAPVSKILCRPEDGLFKIGMFKQLHVSGAPWPARREHEAVRRAIRIRIGRADSESPSAVEVWTVSFQAARRWRRGSRARAEARSQRL